MPLIGRTIGQYKVISELGRGQHSVVYKAWQPSLERHVALKVLRHYDRETLQRFRAEARLTAWLIQQGVPNIREVYEVDQTPDGYLFVALQFVEDSLRQLLRRTQSQGHLINPTAAVRLLEPIAQALDAIHSLGWVHLDIKPQNILTTRDGRTLLADFGIAARQGTRTRACTPTYASPEQAAGDRPVGPWSDIYSLGTVLYEMVAGHPPVRGDYDMARLIQHLDVTPPSPRKVNPRISTAQERAIFKALAKRPQQRYRRATDLLQDMVGSETWTSSIVHTPVQVLNTTSSWLRRKPHWAVLIGILALILLLSLAVWTLWPRTVSFPAATSTPTWTTTPAVTTTIAVTTSSTATRRPTTTSTSDKLPTATLAPTYTPAPRPTRSPTRTPITLPTITPGVSP